MQFCCVTAALQFPHCVFTACVLINEKITLTKKIFRQINSLFSNSYAFSKTVTFTKFLPKIREREFPKFPHCDSVTNITETNSHRKIFRQINSLVKTLLARNFCHNMSECGNYRNFLSCIFRKNFVKVTVLLKKLLSD